MAPIDAQALTIVETMIDDVLGTFVHAVEAQAERPADDEARGRVPVARDQLDVLLRVRRNLDRA